jgi:hypothetical protein
MAIEGIENAKPDAKNLGGLNVIGKYREDLDRLKSARDKVKQRVEDHGIEDDEIKRKLEKLDKSIETLQRLVDDYENEHRTED